MAMDTEMKKLDQQKIKINDLLMEWSFEKFHREFVEGIALAWYSIYLGRA